MIGPKSNALPLCYCVTHSAKFQGVSPLTAGSNLGELVPNFLRAAVFLKRDEIELTSELITYTGFRFVQKSMTLNDLERSKCMCSQ